MDSKIHEDLTTDEGNFTERALKLFAVQRRDNLIYREFLNIVGRFDVEPSCLSDIPFCPIGLFKRRELKTGEWKAQKIFYSSGTTTMTRSQHHIRSVQEYLVNAEYIWEQHFGSLSDYHFVSLLPNYHDNPSSSLLKMVQHFMSQSSDGQERYFVNDQERLFHYLEGVRNEQKKLVLFGVSFALLDYAERYQHTSMDQLMVIETGGMKKFKKEMTRQELHTALQSCFIDSVIYSEYGMTECLSQLYTQGTQSFLLNEQMQVVITDPTDPFCVLPIGKKGRINIIDLANKDTLAFFATDDMGELIEDDRLLIHGRITSSDLRGCNYLI